MYVTSRNIDKIVLSIKLYSVHLNINSQNQYYVICLPLDVLRDRCVCVWGRWSLNRQKINHAMYIHRLKHFLCNLSSSSSDLSCRNLRSKLFGAPDPFLKLHVTCRQGGTKLAHHNQKASTEPLHGTINPAWTQVTRF